MTYTEVSRSGDGQGYVCVCFSRLYNMMLIFSIFSIFFRLVDFDTKKDYDNALNEMQGSELDGNSIEIHFDVS